MQARSREHTEVTQQHIAEIERLGWYHSIVLPDGQILKGLQSIEQLRFRLAQFPIPEDLTGKRVLDIGAWDGWFSFEMERRGARVVAVDAVSLDRFLLAKKLLNSRVEYVTADITKLSPAQVGYFDIVLFFGVLYHTKNPIQALENVCGLATEAAFIESYVTDTGADLDAPPLMEFYETTEHRGQFDNWVGPNTSCLLAFCRTAGFARTKLESVIDHRAHVTCYRKWPKGPVSKVAPHLAGVQNSVRERRQISAHADDYLSLWFKSGEPDLTSDTVYPQIGPYGSRPVYVGRTGAGGWQLNCKLPPGLEPGSYNVSVRTADSDWSNTIPIGVDTELAAGGTAPSMKPFIYSVTDAKTWELARIRSGPAPSLSLWAGNLPEDVTVHALRVTIDGLEFPASFVAAEDPPGLRQVNAILPEPIAPGAATVTLICGGEQSEPATVEFI